MFLVNPDVRHCSWAAFCSKLTIYMLEQGLNYPWPMITIKTLRSLIWHHIKSVFTLMFYVITVYGLHLWVFINCVKLKPFHSQWRTAKGCLLQAEPWLVDFSQTSEEKMTGYLSVVCESGIVPTPTHTHPKPRLPALCGKGSHRENKSIQSAHSDREQLIPLIYQPRKVGVSLFMESRVSLLFLGSGPEHNSLMTQLILTVKSELWDKSHSARESLLIRIPHISLIFCTLPSILLNKPN